MSYRKVLAAAVAAAGVFSAGIASAGHGEGADPYVFTNVGGDHLWSNPANWNQPEEPGPGHVAWVNFTTDEAIIDYAAPSIGELVIGQGGGDGAVRMTTGGSIETSHANLGWGPGRSGILTVDGGAITVLELRMGRQEGVSATVNVSGGALTATTIQMSSRVDGGIAAGADSFLNVSGGTVTSAGPIDIGFRGGNATAVITGGTVTGTNVRIADLGSETTATGSLTITGGTLNALQISMGPSGGGTGVGSFTIGGDATVTTTNHIFLRPNGTFTVDGSEASITVNRVGSTGFEVVNGSNVVFNADAGGFSTVNIPQSTMRFSGPDGILTVDATPLDIGEYDLFTFSSYFSGDHTTPTNRWGTENLTFAPGLSGSVAYNPTSIQLVVVPEPGSLGLLGLAGLALLRRRRMA